MLRKFLLYLMLGMSLSLADVKPAPNARPSETSAISVGFSSAPNFIQVNGALSEVTGTTLKVPLTVGVGHALFVSVVEGSNPAITLTDKLGNSFTRIQTDNNGNLVRTLATYYALNIKGGVDTITAAFNGGANHTRLTVVEYKNIVAIDTFAKVQANAGQPSLSLATRQASDIAICALETNVDTLKGSTFTMRKVLLDMDVLDSTVTTGTVTCNGTLARSQSWMEQLALFKTITFPAGSDTQNVKIKWKSSQVSLPDSIRGYWVELYRNGVLFYYQTSCGAGCVTGIPSRYWVLALPTDTIDSVTVTAVPPPDSGKTADYHISITASSNITRNGQCCVASKTAWYLYRRTNTALAQKALDTIPLTVKMVVPASFGIFGDSFKVYNRMYTDTNSINAAAMQYIGTIFPRNTTFVAKQVRTNRYSYYMTPYLFGALVDTIYLGTMEIPNP